VVEVRERDGSIPRDRRFYAHFKDCHIDQGASVLGHSEDGMTPEEAITRWMAYVRGKRLVIGWPRTRRHVEVPNEWAE